MPKGHVVRLIVASSSKFSGGVSDLLYMKSAPAPLSCVVMRPQGRTFLAHPTLMRRVIIYQ